jgi:SAM-dependent methyltransferase/uncharacterized protein YbaR (Trm112 family)
LKRSHFEKLKPVCPRCRRDAPLEMRAVLREEAGVILEGALACTDGECRCEYPVIDGVPVIVPDVRAYVAGNIQAITGRADLAEGTESLLGDCCGPDSGYDVLRQHLGTYAFDHYGDLDPAESGDSPAAPGSALRLLREGLAAAGPDVPTGAVIDAGCSVGRTSFALAEARDELVLGVDMNFAMLRLASRVLREGVVSYPRRRVGMVYDRREFPAAFAGAERVDFWACDATALPFPAGSFALATSLNLLDCVGSPHGHLASAARVLAPGGVAIFSTPYDWSAAATPAEAWLGGHSQRSELRGAGEPTLRALLGGEHPGAVKGLELAAEREAVPWSVRVHERSVMQYRAHLVVARKAAST